MWIAPAPRKKIGARTNRRQLECTPPQFGFIQCIRGRRNETMWASSVCDSSGRAGVPGAGTRRPGDHSHRGKSGTRSRDVRTGKYLEKQIIWIEGGRIKAIGSEAELHGQLPANARIIDLSHSTLLPGLIDCHTHLTDSPFLMGPPVQTRDRLQELVRLLQN